MPSTSAYLFIEVGLLVFVLGFGWESWSLRRLFGRPLRSRVLGLALFWLLVDLIAVQIGLWSFPDGGSLPIRILGLPVEEYLLFVLHSLVCYVLLRQQSELAQ